MTAWTMPRPAIQFAAGVIGLAAVGAFALGVVNAPHKGRLPGESTSEETGTSAPLQAVEAAPLSQERIEGPPPPPELTPEEKAKLEAEKKAKAEAEVARKAQEADAAAAAAPTAPTPPQGDRIGDVLQGQSAPPPNDDPPH